MFYRMVTVFLLALAALLCCGSKSWAQDGQASARGDADAPFQDWLTLSNHLKSRGIDPVRVNWQFIEPMCLGLKSVSDQVAYNKCKYEKALDSVAYHSDRAQCFTRAKARYPDSLATEQRVETLTKRDKNGVVHTFERRIEPISKREIGSLRDGAVAECMRSLGWANAADWRFGKRDGH